MTAVVVVVLCIVVLVLMGILLLLWDAHSTHKKNSLATFKLLDERAVDLHNRLARVESCTNNTAAWENSYFRPQSKKNTDETRAN